MLTTAAGAHTTGKICMGHTRRLILMYQSLGHYLAIWSVGVLTH